MALIISTLGAILGMGIARTTNPPLGGLQAAKVVLIPAMMGAGIVPLLLAKLVADRETEPIPPTAPTSPNSVRVPNVNGKPIADAEADMKHVGLLVTVDTVVVSTGPQGVVIKQEPAAGEIVPKSSTVKLSVSEVVQPPEETRVRVPDVTKQPFTDARETLQDEDFRVTKRTEPSSTEEKDKVIRTEPPANTLVELESRITVVVGSGPEVQVTSGQDVKAKK